MPVRLEWHRERGQWLRDTWPQGHMRTTGIVMGDPLLQQTPQVVRTEWNEEVQAFPPQRAQKPFAESVGLRRLRRRFQHPKPRFCMLWSSCAEKMLSRS